MALTGNTYQLLWKNEENIFKSPKNNINDNNKNNCKRDNEDNDRKNEVDDYKLIAEQYDNDVLKQALTKGKDSYPTTPDTNINTTSRKYTNPIHAIIMKNDENNLKVKQNPLLPKHQLQETVASSLATAEAKFATF